MNNPAETLLNIRVSKINGQYVTHKPLLLLISLQKCYQDKDRMELFSTYDELINSFSKSKIQTQYAFGRLINDGVWEIDKQEFLSRTDSGDLLRGELISKKVKGGLTRELYQTLINDKSLIIRTFA